MSVAPGNVMPPEQGAAPPPPAAGGVPPEETMQQEQMAQVEAIASSAPQPEKPYSTKLIKKLADTINKLIDKVDKEMADVEYVSEGPKHEGPLPPEVYVPLVLVLGFASQLGFEKYQMDPATLVNDAALRKAQGIVKMMAKDKDLVKQMKEPAEGAPEEEPAEEPAPMPDQPEAMDEEDEALMGMM